MVLITVFIVVCGSIVEVDAITDRRRQQPSFEHMLVFDNGSLYRSDLCLLSVYWRSLEYIVMVYMR